MCTAECDICRKRTARTEDESGREAREDGRRKALVMDSWMWTEDATWSTEKIRRTRLRLTGGRAEMMNE
jgi:hypothetical protein